MPFMEHLLSILALIEPLTWRKLFFFYKQKEKKVFSKSLI